MNTDAVELVMALEESLGSGSDERLKPLAPYRIDPAETVSCVKGGFEIEVAVVAKHRDIAFFVSLDAGQFGVGNTNEFGDVVESNHYPNITMAVRSFVGAIKESGHDL